MAPLHGFKDPRESGKMKFTIQIRPMNPSEEAHSAGNVLTQRLYKYIYEIALEHGDIVRNVKCKWNTLYKLHVEISRHVRTRLELRKDEKRERKKSQRIPEQNAGQTNMSINIKGPHRSLSTVEHTSAINHAKVQFSR